MAVRSIDASACHFLVARQLEAIIPHVVGSPFLNEIKAVEFN